jgi:hypothetical protein
MYIDPNTGGMLFQVLATLLAVFSGILLLFSSKIRAGIARLRRSTRGEDKNESDVPETSSPEITENDSDDETASRG